MSVYWSLGGIDWGESKLTHGSIPRQLPYFCGHVPQKSGARAGGSLNEKTDQKT